MLTAFSEHLNVAVNVPSSPRSFVIYITTVGRALPHHRESRPLPITPIFAARVTKPGRPKGIYAPGATARGG